VLLTERQFIADEAQNVLKIKSDPVPRFIHVMKSLAYVYDLGLANLHIFNDIKGGLIVFNRNVRQGIMTNALISWSPTSFFI